MAFNIKFHMNMDSNTDNYNFIITCPENIKSMIPYIQYEELQNILKHNIFFPYSENNQFFQFHVKMYYIRYLISSGNIDEAKICILNLNQQIKCDLHFEQDHKFIVSNNNIINYRYNWFNGTTILHYAILWDAGEEFITWLIKNGADINIEDYNGNLPGDNVHLLPWFNPSAPFFNTSMVFYSFDINDNEEKIAVRSLEDFNLKWFYEYVGETQKLNM